MTEISKAARNERRKLRATYLNNVAITFFVAGVATPYFAWAHQPAEEAARIVRSLPETLRYSPFVAFFGAIALSLLFHWFSRAAVDEMED